jgi:hypothetical protein
MPTDLTLTELIRSPQYALTYAEKMDVLLPILKQQVDAGCRGIPEYNRYVNSMRFQADKFSAYDQVPYLPVTAFKGFDLCTVPREHISRVLRSSGTTTGTPSIINLDKPTLFRQTQGLAAILSHELGPQRLPYLVLDCEEVNQEASAITARAAALRGFLPFASSVTYGLVQRGTSLEPAISSLEAFFERYRGIPVLLSGFSYIIWFNLITKLQSLGIHFSHPTMTLFHSGGWKHLNKQGVAKADFSEKVAETFGCESWAIKDFYGMVEQVGVIFIDCEAGNKHTPNFAEVVIRDFLSLDLVKPGGEGLIEVLSALPTSYPGQALLTEDVGTLIGYDNCACGRRGLYFRFKSRVEHAEIRGCGDTFASSQVLRSSVTDNSYAPAQPDYPAVEILSHAQSVQQGSAEVIFATFRQDLMQDYQKFAGLPSGVIIGLLDSLGTQLASSAYGPIEGIAFLSSWLRASSLRKILAINFGDYLQALEHPISLQGKRVRAVPRGLVCHWVAGNVPTLAMFSWALSILTKNSSIIRVPKGARTVVETLFRAVEGARTQYEGISYDGGTLLSRTCVLSFPSEDTRTNEAMSLVADARVIWGGNETIRSIAGYPRLDHCEDMIFGPKFSVGVMDRCTARNKLASDSALRGFARDIVLFDQAACSSLQVLFVEADIPELERLADALERELETLSRRFPKHHIDQLLATQILGARARYGLQPSTSVRAPRDLSYSLLLDRGAVMPTALQSRTLFLHAIDNIMEVIPLLSPKIQTIGTAVADEQRREHFTTAAALKGVARCVSPGLMNLYDTPWDGMLPLHRLVRWCQV